jgi:NodT family efflux transporter outer membrane factor (OMF) lipoprotein
MIGPDFKTPQTDVAAQWLEADHKAVDTTRTEYRDWWNVFADPTLTYLIGLAYQQNLTLRAAGVRVLQARAELGVALGELYPQQQNVSAEVNRNRVPFSTPFLNITDPTYWQDAFGAQAAWEIDVWGKLRRAVQSADQAYLASVASYDDVLVTLTGDVASTYVQIRVLQAQLAIARENVARQKQALDIANFRFKAGVATERDVYQAENVLGETEAAIPEALLGLQTATNALRVLLGLPPGPTDDLLGTGPIPIAPEKAAVGIPADLLRRRPDVRKAELDAAAQCAQIGFAKADLLPALTLVGNVGTLASDIGRARLSDVFTQRSMSYSVGPAVQWNILNYGQLSNDVRVQDAKFQSLIVEYQNKVLSAQQEVEDGIAKFVQSRDQVVALTKSTIAAEGALRIALFEYKDGTTDFTTVLNAEENLFKAQNSLATARGNVPLGLIAAYRALGGGWQIREGNQFVPEATRAEMADRTDWGEWLTPDLLQPEAPGLPGPEDTGPTVRPPEW